MFEDLEMTYKNSVLKKSFEVAYIVLRISQSIKNKGFADAFENYAIQLLNNASFKKTENIKALILSIEYLIHLAHSVNLLNNVISETLINELNNLNNSIALYEKDLKESSLNLEVSDILKSAKHKTEEIFEASRQNVLEFGSVKNEFGNKQNEFGNKQNEFGNEFGSDKTSQNDLNILDNSLIENINLEIDSAVDESSIDTLIEEEKESNTQKNINSAIEFGSDNKLENSATENSAIDNSATNSANNSATQIMEVNNEPMEIINLEKEESAKPNENKINSKEADSGFVHISNILKVKEEPTSQKSSQNSYFNSPEESALKKSNLLGVIKRLNEFKLKDIEEAMPDLSERTIRYYLSDLINQGVIEKIGVSGRNVLYRVNKSKI
jgi:hypothetical protein